MTKRGHIRLKKTTAARDFFFLPVFPTPLPPITAILITRLRGEFSGAGHSAIVVMLWMRRIFFFFLSTTSISNSEKLKANYVLQSVGSPGWSLPKRLEEAGPEAVRGLTCYRGSSSSTRAEPHVP